MEKVAKKQGNLAVVEVRYEVDVPSKLSSYGGGTYSYNFNLVFGGPADELRYVGTYGIERGKYAGKYDAELIIKLQTDTAKIEVKVPGNTLSATVKKKAIENHAHSVIIKLCWAIYNNLTLTHDS